MVKKLISKSNMTKKEFIYIKIGKDGSILEIREVSRGHPPSGFIKINRDNLSSLDFGIKKPEIKDPNLITLKDMKKHLMPLRIDSFDDRIVLIECDILKKNKIIDEKIENLRIIPKVEICLLSGDVSVWKFKTSKTPDIFVSKMIVI